MERLIKKIVYECPSCGHKIAKIMEDEFGQHRVCNKCEEEIPETYKERDRKKPKKVCSAKWK
ncbi:MAG: hypothetical protein RR313_03660 [Anaerovoracaceae bacterium]